MCKILRAVAAAVILAATIMTLESPSQASTSECSPNFGTRVPVVLVHGLSGKSDDWNKGGTGSMVGALDRVSGIYVDKKLFDYREYNQEWVDNEHIGPELAKRIACLAAASRQAGGLGKVIVVAHSMGGLATRFASAQKVDGHKIAQDLGLVVTIGTPNTGSGLANGGSGILRNVICPVKLLGWHVASNNMCSLSAIDALRDNSEELKQLPWMPNSTPLRAIAGDVTITYPLFHVTLKKTDGDLIVSKKSALRGMAHTEAGGGETTVPCSVSIKVLSEAVSRTIFHMSAMPPCYHSNLPHNPTVEKATVDAIKKYLVASSPFATFSGTWYSMVTGAVLQVHDSTGTLAWGALPCGQQLTNVCNQRADIQLSGSGSTIHAVVTKRYTVGSASVQPQVPRNVSVDSTFSIQRNLIHYNGAVVHNAVTISNAPEFGDRFCRSTGDDYCTYE